MPAESEQPLAAAVAHLQLRLDETIQKIAGSRVWSWWPGSASWPGRRAEGTQRPRQK